MQGDGFGMLVVGRRVFQGSPLPFLTVNGKLVSTCAMRFNYMQTSYDLASS